MAFNHVHSGAVVCMQLYMQQLMYMLARKHFGNLSRLTVASASKHTSLLGFCPVTQSAKAKPSKVVAKVFGRVRLM